MIMIYDLGLLIIILSEEIFIPSEGKLYLQLTLSEITIKRALDLYMTSENQKTCVQCQR